MRPAVTVNTQLAQQMALLHGRLPMLRWAESAVGVIETTPALPYTMEARLFLGEAVWFLKHGRRHPAMNNDDWAALHLVAHRLVLTGDLDPAVLLLFKDPR